MSSLVRPNVQSMHAYSPGKPIDEVRRELGLDRIIKLASNENPWGPSPKAIAAIRNALDEANYYPDGAAFELRKAISDYHKVPMSKIVLGDGSDEIIRVIGIALLGSPDDVVVMGEPSFAQYSISAEVAPCKLIRIPMTSEERNDLDAIAAACTDRTRIVFLANPNNPTGTAVTRKELTAFIANLPKDTLLVLDEAYYEFAKVMCDDYPSSTEFLAGDRVVGLRTFSKVYGLAGLRVGYGFVPEWLADAVNRIRLPFNVNSLAQVGATAALLDEEHRNKTVQGTKSAIEKLTRALEKVGAKVTPSCANFVWADMGRPAQPIFQALLERGVIVRPGGVFGNPNALRVSAGTAEEMEIFETAITEVVGIPASR